MVNLFLKRIGYYLLSVLISLVIMLALLALGLVVNISRDDILHLLYPSQTYSGNNFTLIEPIAAEYKIGGVVVLISPMVDCNIWSLKIYRLSNPELATVTYYPAITGHWGDHDNKTRIVITWDDPNLSYYTYEREFDFNPLKENLNCP